MFPNSTRATREAVRESTSTGTGTIQQKISIPAEGDTTPSPWLAWSQVLVSHLLVVNGFGYLSSFALFESHWVTALQRSASDVSWVGSIQMFLLFFIGTLSGRAMDAGYFRSLIWTGCSLQLLGVFTTSVCQKYWQLLLSQGIVQGLGNGLLFTPAVALVSTYFSKNRAVALGTAACGAPVGGIIFPVIARQLTPVIGFPWTTRVMGFVMLFNSVVVIVLARPRLVSRAKGPLVEWSAFRERPYALFSVGIFLCLLGVYFAYYYITVFGKEVIHLSSSTSLTLVMIFNTAGIPGRMIPALLADRYFGPFNTLLPPMAGVGIMLIGWAGVQSLGSYIVWVLLYGFCANAVQTLFPSTLASLTQDMTKMGVRIGMCFTIVSVACLTGPPIAGALVQLKDGGFLYAQIFGGSTVLLGTVVLVAARLIQLREDGERERLKNRPATPRHGRFSFENHDELNWWS